MKVNETTVLGAGGEISDLQYILNMLDDLSTEDYCADDGQSLSSQELYSYLSRVMYNRRNKYALAGPRSLLAEGGFLKGLCQVPCCAVWQPDST